MTLLNWLKNLEQSTRLGLSSLVTSFIILFLPASHLEIRLLAGWSAGIFCYLALVLIMMNGAISERVRCYARHQELQHSKVFLLVVFIACISLFAIAKVLANHKDTFTLQVELSIVAIVFSWLLMHTTFALHYATLYYGDSSNSEREITGGLEFSSEESPNFWDFMYFTFTLGMTSQTSDTTIVSSQMRRLALGHTIVSFYFYSVIIALTVSIVSGLI